EGHETILISRVLELASAASSPQALRCCAALANGRMNLEKPLHMAIRCRRTPCAWFYLRFQGDPPIGGGMLTSGQLRDGRVPIVSTLLSCSGTAPCGRPVQPGVGRMTSVRFSNWSVVGSQSSRKPGFP